MLAWMAEWSKALDLSSSIRKHAWVQTPLQALVHSWWSGLTRYVQVVVLFEGLGSNPRECMSRDSIVVIAPAL